MKYNCLIVCAERAALSAAIAEGEKDFEAIEIATDYNEAALPCGACRHVLPEFSPTLKVIAVPTSGKQQQLSLAELLPFPKQGLF